MLISIGGDILKKWISFILIFTIIFNIFVNATYAEETSSVSLAMSNIKAEPGEIVNIPVELHNNPGIVAANLTVSFDEGLTLIGAENGMVMSKAGTFIPPKQLTRGGSITQNCQFVWQGFDIDEADIQDGNILNLIFQVARDVKIDDSLNIEISGKEGDVIDRNLQNVLLSANCTVSVKDKEDKKSFGAFEGIVTKGGLVITSYIGTSENVIIEKTYKVDNISYEVIRIDASAFKGNSNIETVFIPETVSEIGESAFYDCPKLKKVQIQGKDTIIGQKAFGYVIDNEMETTVDGLKIYGVDGSTVQEYIKNNESIEFVDINDSELPDGNEERTKISFQDAEVYSGEIFEIKVNINDNPGIIAANLVVKFDTGLTLVGAENGDVFPSSSTFIPPKQLIEVGGMESEARFVWQGFDIGADEIKDGTILKLRFNVPESAEDGTIYKIVISSKEGDVITGDLDSIVLTTEGKVTVKKKSIIEKIGDLEFQKELEGIVITGYTGTAEELVIEEIYEIRGVPYKVIGIEEGAFEGNETLESVVIPENVKSIATNAFYDCTSLTKVSVKSRDTVIGEKAFGYYLEDGVEKIVEGFTLYGEKGSTAEKYANKLDEISFAEIINEDDVNVKLLVDDISAYVGETIDVIVSIKNNPGIIAANLFVEFDDGLSLVEAISGSVFSENMTFIPPKQLVNGESILSNFHLVWQGFDISEDDIKDGEIAILRFKIAEDANQGSTYNISFSSIEGDVIDKDLNNVVLAANCKVNVNVGEKCNHTGGKATCIHKAVCEKCGEEYGELDGSVHENLVTDEAVEATCTSNGLTSGLHCEDCKSVITPQRVLAKKSHVPVAVGNAVAPGFAITGKTTDVICQNCRSVIRQGSVIPAYGFITVQPKVVKKTSSSVTLRWNTVAGAKKYIIYNVKGSRYEKIAETTVPTYKIKKLLSSTTYKFSVSVVTYGEGMKSIPVKVKTGKIGKPGAVKNIKLKKKGDKTVVTWDKAGGPDVKYCVTIYNASNGEFVLKYTKKNKYTIAGYSKNDAYFIRVRAIGIPSNKMGKNSKAFQL